MVKIKLDENQLYRLFEYHAQQRLPFKDDYGLKDEEFADKNTVENYIDWIEQFGKVGELSKSSISFMQGVQSGMEKAFDWYWHNNGKLYSYEGDNQELIDDKTYEKYVIQKKFLGLLNRHGFYNHLPGNEETKCIFNEKGNMYIERVVVLDNNLGETSEEMFDNLVDAYQDNVGGCWCWAEGGAMAYCERNHGTKVLLRGWIRLDDIDWVETVYINAYTMSGEREIRVKPNAKVELFDIRGTYDYIHDFYYNKDNNEFAAYDEVGDSKPIYKFDLGGRHIIVNATYFGNNGKYNDDGYAEIYDNTKDRKYYRDREGNILSTDDVMDRKFSVLKKNIIELQKNGGEGIDLSSMFESVRNCPDSSYVIVYDMGKYILLNKYNYEIVQNTFFDDCQYNGVYFKVCLNNKFNVIDKNGNYYLDKWYDDVYSLVRGTLCVYDDSINKCGLYKGSKTEFVYDDMNRCLNYQHNTIASVQNEYIEVTVGSSFNLIDLDGKLVSPVWLKGDYTIDNIDGRDVIEGVDLKTYEFVQIDLLTRKIIKREKIDDFYL